MKKDEKQLYLTISEAATRLGVTSATLRNWDRSGKLRPSRHPMNGYRVYSEEQLKGVTDGLAERASAMSDSQGLGPISANRGTQSFPNSPRRPANSPDDLGQHMTPASVAHQMVRFYQQPLSGMRVLDPACGDGNLLLAVAEKMVEAGVRNVHERLMGVDVDERMADLARDRLGKLLQVPPESIRVFHADFLERSARTLFAEPILDFSSINAVISNPPYGKSREYHFFERCADCLPHGAELVFLMPLSFLDRAQGVFAVPLDGRPLGVTTGHAIVRHVCGQPYRFRSIKEYQTNSSCFQVLSGIKLYEVGGGVPPQTAEVVRSKPFSSSKPRKGWLPCLRTGDVHPFAFDIGRLFVKYGEHLAHPKELARFTGPKIFLRRVPIWDGRQLGAVYTEELMLCAGDVLVIRHEHDDKELLQGLCKYLNSPAAAEAVLSRRPSIRFRDSFPKLSAKDINALLEHQAPSQSVLRSLAQSSAREQVPLAVERRDRAAQQPQVDRRFIEVEFPSEAVSESCAREKSIRQGHISTLQLWWARRPLAVCRAAIVASLIPHPDSLAASDPWLSSAEEVLPGNGCLAARINAFLAKLSRWDSSDDPVILGQARRLISTANKSTPRLLDTFAGGGAFPLEALRLDIDAVGSDLNPVAVAALRASLVMLPQHGGTVVEAYRQVCRTVQKGLRAAAAKLYGRSGKEEPLAFFWCRTISCPSCDCELPLLKDMVLSKTKCKVIVTLAFDGQSKRPSFVVVTNPSASAYRAALKGTASSTGATCPRCSSFASTSVIQSLGMKGLVGERLYAIRYRGPDGNAVYRTAKTADERRVRESHLRPLKRRLVTEVPDEALDLNGVRHAWAMQYGTGSTKDLFNRRQGIALLEVLEEMRVTADALIAHQSLAESEAHALRSLLAFTLNRLAMYSSRHSWWQASGEFPANMFGRQAIPFVWNYVEMPFSSPAAGGISSASKWVAQAADHCCRLPRAGRAYQSDAAGVEEKDRSIDLVAIDPPYYDSIAYGYLADVFYVWMRGLLRDGDPELFREPISDKSEEAIVDRKHRIAPALKTDAHFRRKMAEAFAEIRRVLKPTGVALVMFGHKSVKAWDAVMTPMLDAGLIPVASWPVHTERKAKFRHGRIGALSSSCVIVCRVHVSAKLPVVDAEQFVKQHASSLVATIHAYRRNRLYGVDLITAMVAPLVACYAQHEAIMLGARKLTPSDILSQLPDIVRDLQIESAKQAPGIFDSGATVEWIEGLHATWQSLAGFPASSPVLATAKRFAEALDAGAPEIADELWASLSAVSQDALQNLNEIVCLVAGESSKIGRLAHASLGRISLLQRS